MPHFCNKEDCCVVAYGCFLSLFTTECLGLETYLATPSPSSARQCHLGSVFGVVMLENLGCSATPSPSPSSARQCHLGSVFGVVMLENCRSAQFLKGGHHLLLQNVTVHVGIHVSLNEPQLPSTSSTHTAPDHDATNTMLDCRQGKLFLVLLTI